MSDDVAVMFARLLADGRTPESAWLQATQGNRPNCSVLVEPGRIKLLETGSNVMIESRRRWAAFGLTPPWEAGCLQSVDRERERDGGAR